jgi:glycosyltransferase involved in cell wall biosynthesis/LmbE family N-acetylglucosaminyl deacetylase
MQISVVIPCHNAERWIAAALRSVAQQIYQPHEIIVVDDASTDDSLAQIKLSGVDVKLLQVSARNAAAARNSGIEAATGDWIALLDADDKWYPNHLTRAAELLSKTDDVAFMSNHDWIGFQDELLPMPPEFSCKLPSPRSGLDVEEFFRLEGLGFHFGHSTVLYRTNRLHEVGLFDPTQKRRHDVDLWLRMISDRTFTYDTVKSVGYRNDTPGGISTDNAECDYFYLRALTKNLAHIRSPLFRQHLSRQARRAMGIAFVDGPPEHYTRIRALSWKHLEPTYKAFYACAAVWPSPFRALLAVKRRSAFASPRAGQARLLGKAIMNIGRAAVSEACGLALFAPRRRAYRRMLKYDPKQNCTLGFAGPNVETIPVALNNEGFVLPNLKPGFASGFLQLEVKSSFRGSLFDPSIDIEAYKFRDTQYFERGVAGTRFLNVSRLLSSVNWAGAKVRLIGHGLTWDGISARLHLCYESISAGDRVLVIAPHPDDAEIGAFGLYADTNATIVTLTAGEASDRYGNFGPSATDLPRDKVAKLRVWDSITVPQLGGVTPENAINLCFPDGRLSEMHSDPDRDFRAGGDLDFAGLRRLNRRELVANNVTCTWHSLVADLATIISEIRPTIIVAPHPLLDPHTDHLFSTLALSEALETVGLLTGRMFLNCVHNRRSELWPFGPAGTGVALLPILADDGICAEGFYSHPLSASRQHDKFLALEAMHDMRAIEWPGHVGIGQLLSELRGLAHGMGGAPTSYFRRAVRPDEVFFVTSFADGTARAKRAAAQNQTDEFGDVLEVYEDH